jgi:uncharacterized protein (DUF934 family)
MPRRLLRDGQVVVDDWRYLTELEAAQSLDAATGAPALIIPFERWKTERVRWAVHAGRIGVALQPADTLEQLGADLARFVLVAAEFPGPSDGRGYSQGRLLRERHHFTGELRAAGYVRRDQLFFLARCGFNSFELPEHELAGAAAALSTFSAEYQPSNDAGLGHSLQHRW